MARLPKIASNGQVIKEQKPKKKSKIKDFGIMNAWNGKTPSRVKKCQQMKHVVTSKKISDCYHEYSCSICNYLYTVDSSG